jgi:predicted nuclease of predicted toxin-antitoxin system
LKILLDHNLDRRLKQYLTAFEVSTTNEQDWSDLSNGELLSVAERNGFDTLVTADSNIKHQQNFTGRSISVLILRAPNNRLTTHLKMLDDISRALSTIKSGQVVEVILNRP